MEINHVYREEDFTFNLNMVPEMMNVEGNIDMVGYFQSDKYWKHCEEKIMREFKSNDSNLMLFNRWGTDNKIEVEEFVSIHVRR